MAGPGAGHPGSGRPLSMQASGAIRACWMRAWPWLVVLLQSCARVSSRSSCRRWAANLALAACAGARLPIAQLVAGVTSRSVRGGARASVWVLGEGGPQHHDLALFVGQHLLARCLVRPHAHGQGSSRSTARSNPRSVSVRCSSSRSACAGGRGRITYSPAAWLPRSGHPALGSTRGSSVLWARASS